MNSDTPGTDATSDVERWLKEEITLGKLFELHHRYDVAGVLANKVREGAELIAEGIEIADNLVAAKAEVQTMIKAGKLEIELNQRKHELERDTLKARVQELTIKLEESWPISKIRPLLEERNQLRARVQELEERDKQWADKWRATVDTVGNLNAKIVEQDAVISHLAEHCQQKDQLRAELALAVKCVEALKESTFPEHGKHGGPLVRVAAFYEDGTEESKYHGVNTNATNSTAAYDKFKEGNP